MEPASIDSVVFDTPDLLTPDTPRGDAMAAEPRQKLKGRHRLLQGLQRMSSSPALPKRSRAASLGYKAPGKASISCVSLSSSGSPYGHSYGSSYSSEISAGYSTAPTSATSTPGPESVSAGYKPRVRIGGVETPMTAPLPHGVRSAPAEDYFSRPIRAKPKRRPNFNFWSDLPPELRINILRYLTPKEVVRCSAVSRSWHDMCFDGQLWSRLDTSGFYRDIPESFLSKIITSAGPFVRDLNLRGCVQIKEQWHAVRGACTNLQNVSIEGCRIDRSSIYAFVDNNSSLVHINLSGLAAATNNVMKLIGQRCPKLEYLNVSWCNNIDTRGILKVVQGCPNLRDLRAGEVSGWDDRMFMNELFKRNTLERLVLNHCNSVNDESLTALIEGVGSERDVLTDRAIVPPRRLKHLDLTRCRGISNEGIEALTHNVPELEGLQLSRCSITDDALTKLLPTLPNLTHLDLEEVEQITNATLQALANSPCHRKLVHLSISYCENLGDPGMLPVIRNCPNLTTLDMDNTRISDLVLTEAAASIRARNRRLATRAAATAAAGPHPSRPRIGLRLVAYDCANVTWTGVREVLFRNAEVTRPSGASGAGTASPALPSTSPREIIQLKCFYNWQPTVEEHTKRVLRGDLAAAARLERKWADWMMLNEEAGAAGGAGGRRRRRRAREAQMLHADEEVGGEGGEGGAAGVGGGIGMGRRRRARSGPGGCAVM